MTNDLNEQNALLEEDVKAPEINEIAAQEQAVTPEPVEVYEELPTSEAVKPSDEDAEVSDIPEKGTTDYSGLTRREMVQQLRKLLDDNDYAEAIKDDVDAIRIYFYRQLDIERGADLQLFIEKGGKEEDYVVPEDEQENVLKELMAKFRERRNVQRAVREREQQQNLLAKQHIIEELRELISRSDSIGDNYQAFHELQTRWRDIGMVPPLELRNLQDTYHHHVETFYDVMKINKELRDLDFKRNLAAKTELCEKAEALVDIPSPLEAFKQLIALQEQWQELGPVSKDHRVSIWDRFRAAASAVYKRHQAYYDELNEQRQKVIEQKQELFAKAEELVKQPMNNSNRWKTNTDALIKIQCEWKALGTARKKEDNILNRRFHLLCDKFFSKKHDFYTAEKAVQEQNMKLKEELCQKAEALKDSTDWKATTDEMINLQKQWKEVGPAPNRRQEALWRRFRAASNHFFEQKAAQTHGTTHYEANLQQKKDFVKRVEEFVLSGQHDKDLEQIRAFQQEWGQIGQVPFKFLKPLQEAYRAAIDRHYEALKAAKKGATNAPPKAKRSDSLRSIDRNDFDRDKLVKKYKQLQSEIIVWENNIGFFSKSKGTEAMVASVEKKIEKAKQELAALEENIKMIDKYE